MHDLWRIYLLLRSTELERQLSVSFTVDSAKLVTRFVLGCSQTIIGCLVGFQLAFSFRTRRDNCEAGSPNLIYVDLVEDISYNNIGNRHWVSQQGLGRGGIHGLYSAINSS
jgi:hypothetical protein